MDLDCDMLGGRRPYYRFGNADIDPLVAFPDLSDAFRCIDPNRETVTMPAILFHKFDDRNVQVAGRSRHLSAGSTTRNMAVGYAGAINEQDLWPADAIGVSMGGFVARYLATDCGDHVDSLTVAATETWLGGRSENVMTR